jgi:hypothetical protein
MPKSSILDTDLDRHYAVLTDAERRELDKIPYASQAAFDDASQGAECCTDGTRVQLLEDIQAWATNPESKFGFWLRGMAGTGKSTVARTVAENFAQQGFIVASFFFKRGAGDRGSAHKFVTTIMRQLATYSQLTSELINAWSSHENVNISDKTMEKQWRAVVKDPLANIRHDPILLVVDAVDECQSLRPYHDELMDLLSDSSNFEGLNVRLFITSRLKENDRDGVLEMFDLHKIDNETVTGDIERTLRYKFTNFNTATSRGRVFPQDHHIKTLSQRSSPLYIAAITAFRFIIRKNWDVERRFQHLLKHTGGPTAEASLDSMYATIIGQVITANGKESPMQEDWDMYQLLVGSLIVLRDAFSYHQLATLVGEEPNRVRDNLKNFRDILETPELPSPMLIFHKSLSDFLLDKPRVVAACEAWQGHLGAEPSCPPVGNIWIDKNAANVRLFLCCLDVMEGASVETSLKRDICGLLYPGASLKKIDKARVETAIPPNLSYACKYWISHLLEGGGLERDDCRHRISEFIKEHLLHWIEAMSCLKSINEAISQVHQLHRALMVSAPAPGKKKKKKIPFKVLMPSHSSAKAQIQRWWLW